MDDFENAPHKLIRELTLWYADPKKKPRRIIAMRRPLRVVQARIYSKLLLPKLAIHPAAHGGVSRRGPASNAREHRGNTHALLVDIASFYPSITCPMVNDVFLRNACSYEVARALTRLCTYNFHLALGLITSPILANAVFSDIDVRIDAACRKVGLTYTRFVDDITISGKHQLVKSGVLGLVRRLLYEHGFKLADLKTNTGRLDNRGCGDGSEVAITGIRVKRGAIDISKAYARSLDGYLADHLSLSLDEEFCGPLLLRDELLGKIHYAGTVNKGRKRELLSRFGKINWELVYRNAISRGLWRCSDRITEANSPRPDCEELLADLLGPYYQTKAFAPVSADRDDCPF